MHSIPIQWIYDRYKLTPALQRHQRRVAAVSELIFENLDEDASRKIGAGERRAVRAATLLHDMGNVIKFNFDVLPEFLEPQGRDYWQKIKEQFIKRYGNDEKSAIMQIARELGTPTRVQELIDSVGFTNVQENLKSGDLARQITDYADMRVDPHGIVSLEKRITEGKKRWEKNYSAKDITEKNKQLYAECVRCFEELETEIFQHAEIAPKDITNETADSHITALQTATIPSDKTQADLDGELPTFG